MCAAVHAAPSARGTTAFACATSVSIVGVSGESNTTGAPIPLASIGSPGVETYRSTFAAYPDGATTNVSSPTSVGCRNSSLFEPPIAPASAATMTYSRPSRRKMRSYASRCAP